MNIPVPWKEKNWRIIEGMLTAKYTDFYALEKAIDAASRALTANKARHITGIADTFLELSKRHPEISTFLIDMLPTLQNAVLVLAKQKPKLKALISNEAAEITIDRGVIFGCLCGMIFCIFDHTSLDTEYDFPDFSLRDAYKVGNWKLLRFLVEYFYSIISNPHLLDGNITIRRIGFDSVRWSTSTAKVGDVTLHDGRIEDSHADFLVDFANKYIGGGILRGGSVQEEILFMCCPELITTRLFCQKMEDGETIIISGVRRFSQYVGYSRSLQFAGRYDGEDTILNFIAIDATPTNGLQQYVLDFDRDLHKAYVGMAAVRNPMHVVSISSGLWGCGAFGGNPELKFFQQVLAAAQAGIYLQFWFVGADPDFVDAAKKFLEDIRGKTIVELYAAYKRVTSYQRGVFGSVVDELKTGKINKR